jgi:hypothetical protein
MRSAYEVRSTHDSNWSRSWSHGKDPQFTTYIPVSSIEQATALADLTPEALLEVSPRLRGVNVNGNGAC